MDYKQLNNNKMPYAYIIHCEISGLEGMVPLVGMGLYPDTRNTELTRHFLNIVFSTNQMFSFRSIRRRLK
jgi:hypothetical protein